jgi:putative addiction module component (TIGR02574 family)
MVAEQLIESLDEEVSTELSPAWREEILRRCAEVDEGRAVLLDANEVMARAFASLK